MAELLLDRVQMVDQHVGRLAVGIEQPGLVQETDEGLGFFKDVCEIVVFDYHLGGVQVEIDVVEVFAGPAGQMSIEIGPLVVDRPLPGVLLDRSTHHRTPSGKPLLHLSTSNFVVLFALGRPVGGGSCHRSIFTGSTRTSRSDSLNWRNRLTDSFREIEGPGEPSQSERERNATHADIACRSKSDSTSSRA